MTGNLNMGEFRIKKLNNTFPPSTIDQAINYSQAARIISDTTKNLWSRVGNVLTANEKLGSTNDSDVNIIRNGVSKIKLTNIGVICDDDLIMGLARIGGLGSPVNGSDATNKDYVDSMKNKCYIGYIPFLINNNDLSGFTAMSSLSNATSSPFNAFNTKRAEWATEGINSNFSLTIQCPDSVTVWKIAVRGKSSNLERIYDWNFQGSTDGRTFTDIISKTNTYLNTTTQFFDCSSNTVSYSYYRLYAVNAEPPNPGISYFQIYVRDSI